MTAGIHTTPEYVAIRRRWVPIVNAGGAACWRCGQAIVARKVRRRDGRLVSNWHLGHDDQGTIRGPEHEWCNLAAAGRKAGRRRRLLGRRLMALSTSRVW